MAKKKEATLTTKIIIALIILFALALASSFIATMIMLFSGESSYGANVAVIPIEGVLLASSQGSGFGNGVITSDILIEDLKRAEEDPAIEAIILLINSPGGSAVASDEIGQAVKQTEKPIVAVIREVGASGGYWVASSTDHVIANRMSITGSIGVIGSYLSFGKFLEHWNVTYNQLTSGDHKDLGTPYRELTAEEKAFLQEKLDLIHEEFIKEVASNRNISIEQLRPIADGRWLLGSEAKELGLVDELGGEQEALDWINATLKIEPVTTTYEHEVSLLQALAGLKAENPLSGVEAGVSVPMAR